MSNTSCLYNLPFSLTGNAIFASRKFDFQLSFDSVEDQQTVKAYEWYLNGNIILNQENSEIEGKVTCGAHTVGARILTPDGWSGLKEFVFETCKAVSLVISGPAIVNEGSSAIYSVIATLPDSSVQDLTNEYSFSSPDGTFSGTVFTPGSNGTGLGSRPAVITASGWSGPINKAITILDTAIAPGVLTIDLFNNSSLDVIAFVDNPEVADNHVAAYTGANIVPALSSPADALVLASDLIGQSTLNWRFEFNIEKLRADNPSSTSFVFYIKGRENAAQTLSGAFSLKTSAAEMTLSGSPGTYIPGTLGGGNFSSVVNFSSELVAGANGSYTEADLTAIIRLVYDVPTRAIHYTVRSVIELGDLDFMTARYQWTSGAGTDLDIMAGFENIDNVFNNHYVGFGQENATIPANTVPQSAAYLWWCLDGTDTSGYEAALIGIRKFLNDFPSLTGIVEVGLYAAWFNPPLTGNFTFQLETYKGGTMSLDGVDFVNTGGQKVFSDAYPISTRLNNVTHTPANTYKVASLKYNISTQTAVIYINI
ncbi:hypothetical protein SAMN05216464_108166 [Mucilaginibacter pineti]|uniref:Uncharacterized protein n=1 Tax=Mucilaginibacter pineti TaxID=1391627 RepID=A0A1G7EV15_9SPHI|nr:hypothetical protein [Mucilaginibacter pineti]SDE67326.1 hypothetical protein SAMN05216464_108166 [Mucilaginibacter pineti]